MNTPNFHAVARAFRDLAAERDRLERLRNSEAGEIVSEVLAILYIESENHEHRPEFARAVEFVSKALERRGEESFFKGLDEGRAGY